jgi:hypothetical protein
MPVLRRVFDDLVARHLAADRFAAWAGDDQSEDQVSKLYPLGVVQRGVQRLGGLGDRTADATRRLVAGHGQGPSLMTKPGLAERVREQGERPRLALDLPEQEVGKPVLEHQTVLAGRILDRGAERLGGHRAEQEQALLDEDSEPGNAREVAGVVAPQGEDDAPTPGLGDQCVEEPLPLVLVVTQRESLLGLVDEHHRVRSPGRSGQGVHRMTTGHEHNSVVALAS